MRYSLPTSILLHLFVIIIIGGAATSGGVLGMGKGDGNAKAGSKYKGVEIPGKVQERERPTEVTIIERIKDKDAPIKKAVNADKDCPEAWYGGIGIQSRFGGALGDEVAIVYRGFPADLAGLTVGDIIYNVEGGEILGSPGTVVRMTIIRNGKYIQMNITRGKVCYNR